MRKEEVKSYLIIAFVVMELLSMIFNFYFVQVTLHGVEYHFNFSVVFFCLGFFIVDIVADQFSPTEARKFIFYKLTSQMLFLVFGRMAVHVYGLEETQLSTILSKSPWMLVAGILSTYVGFYVMSSIMSHMKIGVYQGSSVFNRYLCSSLPGELIFSLVFTLLCFYQYHSMQEIGQLFLTSAIAKITLSIMFAFLMSLISKFTFFRSGTALQSEPQESLFLD